MTVPKDNFLGGNPRCYSIHVSGNGCILASGQRFYNYVIIFGIEYAAWWLAAKVKKDEESPFRWFKHSSLAFALHSPLLSQLPTNRTMTALKQDCPLLHVKLSLWIDWTLKVCNEKNFQRSGAYISVGIHFTENLKVPAERPWKIQFFDIWYIFVGQILLGLHQSNQLLRYWIISNLLLWNALL